MTEATREVLARDRRGALVASLFFVVIPFIILFVIYWASAAPGAWWGDGMELTCAARTLGIPHPTGYPFYIALGHLLIRIFAFLEPARVMTLFSSFCCAVGAVLIGRSTSHWLRGDRENAPSIPSDAIGVGVALIAGFSRTLWEHATFAEVYPLNFLLVSAMVWWIVRRDDPESSSPARFWFPLAILWGLAMLHHYSALAILPLLLLAVGFRRKKLALPPIALFVAVSAMFLLGYGFILIRAGMNPPLNWGDPSTWDRFLAHITGGDYGALNQLRRQSAGGALGGVLFWIGWWGRQLLPEPNPGYTYVPTVSSILLGAILVVGGISGSVIMLRRSFGLATGLLLSLFITLAFSVIYIIPDRDGYFLPALPAMLFGWITLLQNLAQKLFSTTIRWNRISVPITVSLAAALMLTQSGLVDKSNDRGPQLWADAVFAALPKDALVITQPGNDNEIYALWHAQMVEGKRPDVTVFGGGFIFKGWYRKYFEHASRPRLPLFIDDRPPTDKATFDVALAAGVVLPNLDSREVFFTYPESNPLLQLNPATPADSSFIRIYERYLQTGGTTYPFILPSGPLARASMDPASREAARREFGTRFGLEPPR